MNSKNSINVGILLVGIVSVVLLTRLGCNTNVKEVEKIEDIAHAEAHSDEQAHSEPNSSGSEKIDFPPSSFDGEIDIALANIKKGEEQKDQNMMMNEGIMKILAISRQDTNNVRANYYLALFAIQSGQIEKAEKRLEKLILLQPENQEYQKMLADLRKQNK